MDMHVRNKEESEREIKEIEILENSEDELVSGRCSTKENALKEDADKKIPTRKYRTKHMRLYPELYRSDVTIHPSYTTLKNLPYYVVCRRRVQRIKKQINRQLNREIMHFAMMQMFAIDSVRVDRVFSIGMSPKSLIVPDFATEKERRHINELLRDT